MAHPRGHIIDLSCGVRPAIRFLRTNPRLWELIESVSIYRPSFYTGHFTEDDIFRLFAAIGCLPHLKTLTIHFDNLRLPVYVLTTLLTEAQGLLDLGLYDVSLSGSPEDFEDMEEALQQHQSLEGARLVHCQRHPDSLLNGENQTENADDKENASTVGRKRIPRMFCCSRNLRRLWLQDCPDNHIVAVAQAIKEHDTQLKELSIVSSTVGDNGVESLSQMLKADTTLEELRITAFRGHAIRIAESVDPDSTLKKLTCDILVPHSKPSLLTDGPRRI